MKMAVEMLLLNFISKIFSNSVRIVFEITKLGILYFYPETYQFHMEMRFCLNVVTVFLIEREVCHYLFTFHGILKYCFVSFCYCTLTNKVLIASQNDRVFHGVLLHKALPL